MGSAEDYSYLAYIDEAGDDGLRRVRPVDSDGSSEWLVVSAVVIDASRESEVLQWSDDLSSITRAQGNMIHFRRLSARNKLLVCERMAALPARYFAVCSNKKNMKGYENPFAKEVPSKNWFYNWMTRLLLERVTDFVYRHSLSKYGSPRKLRVEYSNRGGLSYAQMRAYFRWINFQGNNTFLRFGKLHWDVIDFNLLKVYPAHERAGLQLADAVASAFFKACDVHSTGGCDPIFAQTLNPRVARHTDRLATFPAGYGVKLMPNLQRARLTLEQREIFSYYGYPKQWWAPDPSDRAAC